MTDHTAVPTRTAEYGRTAGTEVPSHSQVIDFKERREVLLQKKEPTVGDAMALLDIERRHSDAIVQDLGQLRRDVETAWKEDELVRGKVAQTTAKANKIWESGISNAKWMAVAALVIGSVSLIWAWSTSSSIGSVQTEIGEVKQTVAAEVVKFAEYKAFVSPTLVAMEKKIELVDIKADQDVLDKLAKEVKARQGIQDEKLTSLSTQLMAAATKDDLKEQLKSKASAAVVRDLRARVKQLEALQPKPVQAGQGPVSF